MCIDILSAFKIISYCSINRTTLTITFPNGSVFLFCGLDDSEKIKSIAGITDIVCEEATELTLDDVSQLDLRLRANVDDLQIYYMFNPTSKASWVYKRWFAEDAEVDTETTFILHTSYKDNRFLPQEYIDALEEQKKTNPTYYRIYALGEFASLDKLVYQNVKIEDFDEKADDKKKLPLLCALDFGYVNDLTAFLALLLDEENKKIYIFKEWGDVGKTNDEIAAVISTLGFSKSVIIADSAEQKSIEEIKRLGIPRIKPCKKGKGSVLQGIQRLQQYEIIVKSQCEKTIIEFQNYSWKKSKDGEYINEPVDNFNHFMDCLRYATENVGKNRLRTIDKASIGF